VLGLVAILLVMLQAVWFLVINEINQAHFAMKAEVVNHLCEAAAEEVVMNIRREMNKHKGTQTGNFYGLFRSGAEDGGMSAPDVDCPVTREMAKKLYGIRTTRSRSRPPSSTSVLRHRHDGRAQVPATNKGCLPPRVVAQVE
jgi:hypothetical protein